MCQPQLHSAADHIRPIQLRWQRNTQACLQKASAADQPTIVDSANVSLQRLAFQITGNACELKLAQQCSDTGSQSALAWFQFQ